MCISLVVFMRKMNVYIKSIEGSYVSMATLLQHVMFGGEARNDRRMDGP
jgi:hypothetical protein